MLNHRKDIKIMGAGLAGLTAGINLIKAGYHVTIYEKRKGVGLRFNNDFQGIVNWMTKNDVLVEIEKMNIKINFLNYPLKKELLWFPKIEREIFLESLQPIFYLVKRGPEKDCLDISLKNQFIEMGGKIKFNTSFDLDKAQIIATGPKGINLLTSGYNFETNFQDIFCELIDKEMAPGAYAYLLVKNNKGTIATVSAKKNRNQKECLEKIIKIFQKKLGINILKKEVIKGFADFNLVSTARRDKVLYCGEAAGFQDDFLGLGMFVAIKSGFLAAKSISEKKDYDKLWKEQFGNYFKASLVNRFLFEKFGYVFPKIISGFIEKNKKNPLALIKKTYTFDWRKKLLYPLAYLFFVFKK